MFGVIQHIILTYIGYEWFKIMSYYNHNIPQFSATCHWSLPLAESVICITESEQALNLEHCIFIQVILYWDQCTGWIKANRSFGMSRHKQSRQTLKVKQQGNVIFFVTSDISTHQEVYKLKQLLQRDPFLKP
jgi:predicted transcriptional regulator